MLFVSAQYLNLGIFNWAESWHRREDTLWEVQCTFVAPGALGYWNYGPFCEFGVAPEIALDAVISQWMVAGNYKSYLPVNWNVISYPQQRLHILRCHSELHLKVNIDPPQVLFVSALYLNPGIFNWVESWHRHEDTLWEVQCTFMAPGALGYRNYGPFCEFGLAPEIALDAVDWFVSGW